MAMAMAMAMASHSVFVYGTLMDDDVVHSVIQRVPRSSTATLHGYQRHCIKGRVYPAIVPALEKTVDGKVLLDLTDRELDILDDFEDTEYVRTLVEVSLLEKETETIRQKAFAYVWSDLNDKDLYGEWDFQEWKNVNKEAFLNMCRSYITEVQHSNNANRISVYETSFEDH